MEAINVVGGIQVLLSTILILGGGFVSGISEIAFVTDPESWISKRLNKNVTDDSLTDQVPAAILEVMTNAALDGHDLGPFEEVKERVDGG